MNLFVSNNFAEKLDISTVWWSDVKKELLSKTIQIAAKTCDSILEILCNKYV